MCRLCAPFAVLRTLAGFGVDDGTHVELTLGAGSGNLVRGRVEGLAVGRVGQPGGLFGRYVKPSQYLLLQCFNGHRIGDCLHRAPLFPERYVGHVRTQASDGDATPDAGKGTVGVPAPSAET